jgi:putative ABC transport system substrate-binding protein
MRRREFITLLGSGVAGWPLAARAQQSGKLPTIGFSGRGCFGLQSMDGCFRRTPTRTGWIENHNVAIEYRWSEGRTERYAEITAEFVQST